MSISTLTNKIKNVKIQGATNIALHSVNYINKIIHQNHNLKKLKSELEKTKKTLINIRPTEPFLFNCLKYISSKEKDPRKYREDLLKKTQYVFLHIKNSERILTEYGIKKVHKGSKIFTHCHSSAVMSILKQAQKQKSFIVNNTESRPLYQGRLTVKELTKHNIKVNHFVDSAAKLAITHSDAVFLGCDAITSKGYIINKIGSDLFAEIAHNHHIPVYICTDSWKFNTQKHSTKIEYRDPKEIWNKKLKNLDIHNPAFEIIHPKYITSIISELGFHKIHNFITEFKHNYSFLI